MKSEKAATHSEYLEERRSAVRVRVTYLAAVFIFGGGLLVLVISLIIGATTDLTDSIIKLVESVKELYLVILPIATTVVTYWFATRKPNRVNTPDTEPGETDAKSAAT